MVGSDGDVSVMVGTDGCVTFGGVGVIVTVLSGVKVGIGVDFEGMLQPESINNPIAIIILFFISFTISFGMKSASIPLYNLVDPRRYI
jgi:hypothetical protein